MTDLFFLVLFAYQTPVLNLPKDSHTFATFVRASREGRIVERFTISWLPARMAEGTSEDISLLQKPEPGVNVSLEQSLRLGSVKHRKTSRWGPFQIRSELYRKARERYGFLNSGRLQYTVLDGKTREAGTAVNCIHAVSEILPPCLRTGCKRGVAATEDVLVHFLQGDPDANFIRYPEIQDWLAPGLGIEAVAHAGRVPVLSR